MNCPICNNKPCVCGDEYFMFEGKEHFTRPDEPETLVNEDNDVRDIFDDFMDIEDNFE